MVNKYIKIKEFINKSNLVLTVLLLFLLFIPLLNINAQTVSRQCLASSGNGIIGNSVLVNQTIGQPYGTSPYYSNGIRYTPGFQQPVFQLQTINSSIHTKVFPNPTASQVTIETDEIVENVRIQVMDVTGKYLLNETVSVFQKHTINCNAWTNGTYLIVLSNGKSSLYSSKLIISK